MEPLETWKWRVFVDIIYNYIIYTSLETGYLFGGCYTFCIVILYVTVTMIFSSGLEENEI